MRSMLALIVQNWIPDPRKRLWNVWEVSLVYYTIATQQLFHKSRYLIALSQRSFTIIKMTVHIVNHFELIWKGKGAQLSWNTLISVSIYQFLGNHPEKVESFLQFVVCSCLVISNKFHYLHRQNGFIFMQNSNERHRTVFITIRK